MLAPHRLNEFDSTGHHLRSFGTVPLVADGVPVTAAQQILQPSAAIRPGTPTLAVGARYAGRIDIYDLTSGNSSEVRAPDPFVYGSGIGSNGTTPGGGMNVITTDGQTRFGYIALAATKDRIYGLFSGRTRSAYPGRANLGQVVHVFDWEGHFIAEIHLDEEAIRIAVTPDDDTLYSLTVDPEPTVREHTISGAKSGT